MDDFVIIVQSDHWPIHQIWTIVMQLSKWIKSSNKIVKGAKKESLRERKNKKFLLVAYQPDIVKVYVNKGDQLPLEFILFVIV